MDESSAAGGPLAGLKVLELAAIGPVPFAGMLLSDMGADVVCITRPGTTPTDPRDIVSRGRRFVELDLKSPDGVAAAHTLSTRADALLEGFRPGVMERLGLGPDRLTADNPRLVYGRMTGWGQAGPLAPRAGHDITYIAIAGALDAIRGGDGRPVAPLNLVGDYGGGAMFLVAGVLAALLEAGRSGRGQVVDAAMVDGTAALLSMFHSRAAFGDWRAPGTNLLDGGAPFYDVYPCADGRFIAVGALEPQFYAELRRVAGLADPIFDAQDDRAAWPAQTARLAEVFASKPRNEWLRLFDGSDACVAPVLSLAEAPAHPHLAARETFVERDGVRQAAPAPRFSRTPSSLRDVPFGCRLEAADLIAEWSAS